MAKSKREWYDSFTHVDKPKRIIPVLFCVSFAAVRLLFCLFFLRFEAVRQAGSCPWDLTKQCTTGTKKAVDKSPRILKGGYCQQPLFLILQFCEKQFYSLTNGLKAQSPNSSNISRRDQLLVLFLSILKLLFLLFGHSHALQGGWAYDMRTPHIAKIWHVAISCLLCPLTRVCT